METVLRPTARDTRPQMDDINRHTWAQRDTVRIYEKLQGWTDPGERAAIEYITERARGRAILDVGVGAGRTTTLLLPISRNYVGIDYTVEMVRACRRRFPDLRIDRMDARDLSAFDDGRFSLVCFSFNGIDAVDMAGRRRVLREVHRVLQDGGTFLFSAHNHDGPGRGERPKLHVPFTWNPVRLGWRTWKSIRSLLRALLNHHRLRSLNETHESWCTMNAGAHDFGIVVMYTSLAEQLRQLRDAGFQCEAIFESSRGESVRPGADTRKAGWLHYVARKA